jgi:phosphate acetyltransferase
LDEQGLKVAFVKPIAQMHKYDEGPERSTSIVHSMTQLDPPQPISLNYAQKLIGNGQLSRLMEEVVGMIEQTSEGYDAVIVEGLVPENEPFIAKLNAEIAQSLNASVLLTATPSMFGSYKEFEERIAMTSSLFGAGKKNKVIGVIVNKLNSPAVKVSQSPIISNDFHTEVNEMDTIRSLDIFRSDHRLLGTIPWQPELMSPRTTDVCNHLKAEFVFKGTSDDRRVVHMALCAKSAANMTEEIRPGALLITPGDRHDIIMAVCLAAMKGVPLAGLVVTGGLTPPDSIIELCRPALETGLPVMKSNLDSFNIISRLTQMNHEVPTDDTDRINKVMDSVASNIDGEGLRDLLKIPEVRRLSPPAFRYQLVKRAQQANKRVVLPEGEEPRTIQAAAICAERDIARCVLIGNEARIYETAKNQGIELPTSIEILDPDKVRHNYISPYVELRKHKGVTAPMAEALLEDSVVLGTMMLAMDEVDGLVSGALHTTANTIRPALQLIKTSANAKQVSSVFFMCLPEQVLVYGDCAVNPAPDAELLADIAIQSADSASAFGIDPKVAMISYSTGKSGTGADVEKVIKATKIAQELRPDLILDGPLQYDAAAIENVAKSKAPDSPVAGQATIFVFPDLNTGNTTYKAVQRSANVISIGPMLQGLRKPVNDLSRGALVEDIVFTIALTAIQAKQTSDKLLEK